ncbi:hypothetical protein EIP91_004560 [Steccherinum ochraceum]|uniref:G-alpha-domain-containing protein n=1 Tax=Steccherinum ochraceum TaxID=92696 RepID=A0A4R0RJY2_9APHY|nr:hypothetical protein EIP91_004560 [Steccherinum ochraceum]
MFGGRMRRRRTVSLTRETQRSPPPAWPPPPPSSETEEARSERHHKEREAKRVNAAIEKQIEKAREDKEKRKSHTKILILGQSESGKSTILKQFQLFYAPQAFRVEAEAWRAVIHLNLVRSINLILDIVATTITTGAPRETMQSALSISPPSSRWGSGGASVLSAASSAGSDGHGRNALNSSHGQGPSVKELRMRLSPLKHVESILVKRLTADDHSGSVPRPPSRGSSASSTLTTESTSSSQYARASEVIVRGGSGWKELVRRGKQIMQGREWQRDEFDDARQILHACREDVTALWSSAEVQEGLRNEGVLLRNQSGFFLDDAMRVAAIDYEPSFRDILKARIQTMGVEEHEVVVEAGDHPFTGEVGSTWLFYDVGGSRHQRAAWAPFFDDVNAIIFLCPMSGFNEFLVEDRTMNRLLDSFTLWKTVCGSKVLANVTFILFLNKSDILRAKLEAGQSFVKWVRSYKEGQNDVTHVSEYLKSKFIAIHKSSSPKKRPLHVHVTCALDVERMAKVIVSVREVIIEANLVESTLL